MRSTSHLCCLRYNLGGYDHWQKASGKSTSGTGSLGCTGHQEEVLVCSRAAFCGTCLVMPSRNCLVTPPCQLLQGTTLMFHTGPQPHNNAGCSKTMPGGEQGFNGLKLSKDMQLAAGCCNGHLTDDSREIWAPSPVHCRAQPGRSILT